MEVDEFYMRRALQIARHGYGTTSPNPMVGAVITGPDGMIIGEGWHRYFGGPHAEVNAVRSVTDRHLLPHSTIYVTLEPCSHYGKTPPCADLLAECGFRRVVVGTTDPNERVSGRGIKRLRDAGIEVTTHVLEKECRLLNPAFITSHTLHRPYIMLKWACSSDGFLDCRRQPGQPAPKFSTPETLMLMHRIRAGVDAIMIGSETALNDNPRLDTRLFPGHTPLKIIVDGRGRVNPGLKVFENTRPLIVTGSAGHPAEKHAETLIIPDPHNLNELFGGLFCRGITSVMVEGGATLLNALTDSGLWDEARIEIAPVALGPEGKIPMQIPRGATSSVKVGHNIIINVKNTLSV